MASAAIAEVNGIAAPEAPGPESPQPVNSSAKRKRDASDEDSADKMDGVENIATTTTAAAGAASSVAVNGTYAARDQKALIRDYFEVLRR